MPHHNNQKRQWFDNDQPQINSLIGYKLIDYTVYIVTVIVSNLAIIG